MDLRNKIYDEPTLVNQRNHLNSRKSFHHHHQQTENGYAKAYIEKYDRPDFYSGSTQQLAPDPYHDHRLTSAKDITAAASIPLHSQLRSSKSLGNLNGASSRQKSARALVKGTSSGSVDTLDSSKLLSEAELNQIESFFKGNKSYVYVCQCLANLYFTNTDLYNGGRESKPRVHEWTLSRTGVPVLIFDKGETKSRDKRQLQILLSERGSGFVLWRDIIDNLSAYKSEHPSFHTLYLSSDHRKMAGLSFDHEQAAEQFLKEVESITSDPINLNLNAPKKSAAARKIRSLKKQLSFGSGTKPSREKNKLPRKCDISSPCLFQHVNSVDLTDSNHLYSLSNLVLRDDDDNASASSPIQPVEPATSASSPMSNRYSSSAYTTSPEPHSNHNYQYNHHSQSNTMNPNHSHYQQQPQQHPNIALSRRRSLSTSGGSSASSSSSPIFHQHTTTAPSMISNPCSISSSSAAPSSILSHDL